MRALPCCVCGTELRNVVFDDADNQPSEGTGFLSHGHYGSTAFDPMDGTYLELNICDPCLTRLGREGKVAFGRDRKPVLIPGPPELPMPSLVGWTAVHRPLVEWDPSVEAREEDRLLIENYEEWELCADKIESHFSDEAIREMFERREVSS